jgi:hypothetical protein
MNQRHFSLRAQLRGSNPFKTEARNVRKYGRGSETFLISRYSTTNKTGGQNFRSDRTPWRSIKLSAEVARVHIRNLVLVETIAVTANDE